MKIALIGCATYATVSPALVFHKGVAVTVTPEVAEYLLNQGTEGEREGAQLFEVVEEDEVEETVQGEGTDAPATAPRKVTIGKRAAAETPDAPAAGEGDAKVTV